MDIAYVDTCVWVDCYQDRAGQRGLIDQAEAAADCFGKIKSGKYGLATSDHLEQQINNAGCHDKYGAYVSELDKLGLRTHVTVDKKDEQKAAERFDELPEGATQYEDVLHFILALKAGAKILVTQNEQDFKSFKDEIKVVWPNLMGLPHLMFIYKQG